MSDVIGPHYAAPDGMKKRDAWIMIGTFAFMIAASPSSSISL